MARAAKGEGTLFKTDNGWRGYVTVNGARKYFSAKTKAEASQKRRQLLTQRDHGQLSVEKSPTVLQWLEHWMTISKHRPTTAAGYRHYIKTYMKPIHAVRLDKLTIEHLEELYAQMERDGFSGSTRHQTHAIIRVALKHAVRRGHMFRNVAALVQPPSVGPRKTNALSEADLQALYAAVAGDRYEARWLLSLQMGLRPGEATGLQWPDLDFDTGVLHVHRQIQAVAGKGAILVDLPKTAAGDRRIPLPSYLLDMLKRRREDQLREMIEAGDSWNPWTPEGQPTAMIFTQVDGQPLRPKLDHDNWHALLAAAGLPKMRRYVSRHTAASMMIANDVDVATVSATLGHANPAFTMSVYTHAIDERREELAVKLDRLAAPYFAPYVAGEERSGADKESTNAPLFKGSRPPPTPSGDAPRNS